MTIYAAEISTGAVNEIIVGNYVWANENLNGQWVDCTCNDEPCAGIGYVYDATTETFSPPPAPTPLEQ
jgi:hypothetical protein